jgi:hypothetical protein
MGGKCSERQAEHRAFATRQPSSTRQSKRSEGWAQTDRSIPAAVDVNKQLCLVKGKIFKRCCARKREEIVGWRSTITRGRSECKQTIDLTEKIFEKCCTRKREGYCWSETSNN